MKVKTVTIETNRSYKVLPNKEYMDRFLAQYGITDYGFKINQICNISLTVSVTLKPEEATLIRLAAWDTFKEMYRTTEYNGARQGQQTRNTD